jgi:hypothetical protein
MLQRETLIYAECCSSIVPCQLETHVRKVDSSSFALCLLPALALPRDFLRHPVRVLPHKRDRWCVTLISLFIIMMSMVGGNITYFEATPNVNRSNDS